MKYMLAVLFVLSLLVPTFSQDITPTQEKPVATVEATVEAVPTAAVGGVTVINNTSPDVPVSTDTSSAGEPWLAKYVAALAGLIVVASTFLGAFNRWIESKSKDASFMTGAELVAGYAPAIAKDAAKGFVKSLIAAGENLQSFLDEATDGTPYVVKVHTPTPPAVLPHDPTSPEA